MPEHEISVNLSAVYGPLWWAKLEQDVAAINCPPCRAEGQALLSAMHDLMNLKLGKPLFDANNFRRVATEYGAALNALASQGK